jgi:hypothetical protein
MTPHPQRCVTCGFHTIPIDEIDRCNGDPITIGEFEAYQKRGCASHSSQQRERDKVPDEVVQEIKDWLKSSMGGIPLFMAVGGMPATRKYIESLRSKGGEQG